MSVLIQPAIDLAQKGFAITEREANLLNETREDFLKHNSHPTAFTKNSPWKKGDILVFTTNFRPVKGTKGYYRVNMKHGVSEIHSGEDTHLELFFMMLFHIVPDGTADMVTVQ